MLTIRFDELGLRRGDRVLDVGGFNLHRAVELEPRFLELEYPFEWAGAYPLPAGTHTLEIGHCDHDHGHDHGHDHDHDEHVGEKIHEHGPNCKHDH